MDQKIVTCLMFSGQAEEAIRFYTSVFSPAEIEQIVPQENGIMFHATFRLKGQRLMILPLRCVRITGNTALVTATNPKTFVANCRSHSSRVSSSTKPPTANPALLTNTSIRP